MGKMYTLQPNESINDHVKESMSIINHIVELSIGCMRDLANPREGTFVDMTYDKFMRSLEHIRESIQMLDELCDEQDEDNSRLRSSLEKLTGKCPYHDKYCDYDDCGECEYARITALKDMSENCTHFQNLAISRNKELEQEREKSNQLEKELSRLKAQYGELQKELKDTAFNRDANLKLYTAERERSNQLEEKNRKIKDSFELAKKYLHRRHEQISRLEEKLRQTKIVKDAQKKVIDEKQKQICDLHHEIWDLQEQAEYWEDLAKKYADPDGHSPNNPQNFCGNCKYFTTHPNDVATCNNKHADPFIIDPDDASCSHFKPTYDTRVVIGKPEFPCCDHCSRDDCDNCTLCPF